MMTAYRDVTSSSVIHQLEQLAAPLRGAKVLHINSTKEGGGVAEILHKLIPLKQALGIEADWEIITGNQEFYQCTKGFHNALQGMRQSISEKLLRNYEKTNKENGERLKTKLQEADFVFIHDPQPAPLLKYTPERLGNGYGAAILMPVNHTGRCGNICGSGSYPMMPASFPYRNLLNLCPTRNI
jgi:trehalose synthase